MYSPLAIDSVRPNQVENVSKDYMRTGHDAILTTFCIAKDGALAMSGLISIRDWTHHCGHETVLVAIETSLICGAESLNLIEGSYNWSTRKAARTAK